MWQIAVLSGHSVLRPASGTRCETFQACHGGIPGRIGINHQAAGQERAGQHPGGRYPRVTDFIFGAEHVSEKDEVMRNVELILDGIADRLA